MVPWVCFSFKNEVSSSKIVGGSECFISIEGTLLLTALSPKMTELKMSEGTRRSPSSTKRLNVYPQFEIISTVWHRS